MTNLDLETKRTYAIATLLHPCFKTYDFIDDLSIIPASDKEWALRELRTEWATVWKAKAAPADATTTDEPGTDAPAEDTLPVQEPGTSTEPPKKSRKVSLAGLLGGRVKKEAASPAAPAPLLDELEQYLADTEESSLDVKVLSWWQAKESKWPALAKMVKQYFAAPASSAGVERVFSAAGNMHGDLQKSAKDSTLEHSLFAAFNTD
jgi:hypothetical protein